MTNDEAVAWVPPSGPALSDSQTRVAHRRWREDEQRRVGLTWVIRIGSVVLLVTGVWSLFVGAGWWFVIAFFVAIWLVSVGPRRVPGSGRSVLAQVRTVSELLETQPWTSHRGRLRQDELPVAGRVRWILLDPEDRPLGVVEAGECDRLTEVVHSGAPLWTCSPADGAVAVVYAPHREGGRLYAVRPFTESEAVAEVAASADPEPEPAVDDALLREAWRLWWKQRATALRELGFAVVAGAVAAVLGVRAWGNGEDATTTALAIGAVVAGLAALVALILAFAHDVSSVVSATRVRRTLTTERWSPFEGQLLHHTWIRVSGEGDGDNNDPVHGWVLLAHDGTQVQLDPSGPSATLERVMAGTATLWVAGTFTNDPLVLGPSGPAVYLGTTLRTKRQRNRAEGATTKLFWTGGHRTERSPRMPRR